MVTKSLSEDEHFREISKPLRDQLHAARTLAVQRILNMHSDKIITSSQAHAKIMSLFADD